MAGGVLEFVMSDRPEKWNGKETEGYEQAGHDIRGAARAAGLRAAERDFTQYVNPLMGTQCPLSCPGRKHLSGDRPAWGMNF